MPAKDCSIPVHASQDRAHVDTIPALSGAIKPWISPNPYVSPWSQLHETPGAGEGGSENSPLSIKKEWDSRPNESDVQRDRRPRSPCAVMRPW